MGTRIFAEHASAQKRVCPYGRWLWPLESKMGALAIRARIHVKDDAEVKRALWKKYFSDFSNGVECAIIKDTQM